MNASMSNTVYHILLAIAISTMESNDSRNGVDFIPLQVPKTSKKIGHDSRNVAIPSIPNVLGRFFHTLGAEHLALHRPWEPIARVL